ncbi:MAG: Stress-induced protein [Candidatus Adlerbacteria bacterium]|nr:Stress-induced protein [Candidatus Adlerbacteria bacterium]
MQQEQDEQGQPTGELDEMEQQSSSGGGRGFAGMSEEQRRAIASKGGKSQGKDNNPGNFANDREKAVAAGRVGGQNSHGGGRTGDENDSEE